MNEQLKAKLDEIFAAYEKTDETQDLYDEALSNLTEAVKDNLSIGLPEETAIDKAFEQAGDLTEVLKEIAPGRVILPLAATEVSTNIPEYVSGFFGRLPLVNQRTFTAHSLVMIELKFSSDDFELKASEDEKFHFLEYMNNDNPRYFAKIDESAGRLKIESGERPHLFGHMRPFRSKSVLQIPELYENDVKTELTSGNLTLSELSALKDLEINCTSGNIKAQELTLRSVKVKLTSGNAEFGEISAKDLNIEVSSGNVKFDEIAVQQLTIKATSGNVKLEELTSQELKVEASSGNLKIVEAIGKAADFLVSSGSLVILESVFDTISAQSGSGNINFKESLFGSKAEFVSNHGNVNLELSEDVSFAFELETGSGHTKIEMPDVQFSKNTMSYKAGNVNAGETSQLHVKSGNGNVNISNS